MSTYFYKITDPKRYAAWRQHQSNRQAVVDAGMAFIKQFLGEGQTAKMFTSSLSGQVHGYAFTPPMQDDVHWCKASSNPSGIQSPRNTPKKIPGGPKITQEQKAAHADLLADWRAGFPKIGASFDELIQGLMGLPYDFMSSFSVQQGNGDFVLVRSSRRAPNGLDGVDEILGSQYEAEIAAAKKAREAVPA